PEVVNSCGGATVRDDTRVRRSSDRKWSTAAAGLQCEMTHVFGGVQTESGQQLRRGYSAG
ncbi:hypothetical protein BaRGS_00020989, partial [Batillaria attramentaria]